MKKTTWIDRLNTRTSKNHLTNPTMAQKAKIVMDAHAKREAKAAKRK